MMQNTVSFNLCFPGQVPRVYIYTWFYLRDSDTCDLPHIELANISHGKNVFKRLSNLQEAICIFHERRLTLFPVFHLSILIVNRPSCNVVKLHFVFTLLIDLNARFSSIQLKRSKDKDFKHFTDTNLFVT